MRVRSSPPKERRRSEKTRISFYVIENPVRSRTQPRKITNPFDIALLYIHYIHTYTQTHTLRPARRQKDIPIPDVVAKARARGRTKPRRCVSKATAARETPLYVCIQGAKSLGAKSGRTELLSYRLPRCEFKPLIGSFSAPRILTNGCIVSCTRGVDCFYAGIIRL